jgi:hypothetical protein
MLFRDTFSYKINAFFPLGAAFYTVFVPYRILTAATLPGYYELLFIPLMYAIQITSLSFCLNQIFNVSHSPKFLFVLLFFIYTILPPAAEATRLISTQFLLYGGISAAFFVFSLFSGLYYCSRRNAQSASL